MKLHTLLSKTKVAGIAFVAAAAFIFTPPAAQAVSVTLTPSSQTIGVGGVAIVDLNISGLGDLTAPSLGGWSVWIAYNPAIVGISFANVTFGTGLGISDTFPSDAGGGLVELYELSFESIAALNSSQADSFTLATMAFTGLAPGTSALEFTFLDLTDVNGATLAGTSVDGSITVQAGTSVPEGSAALPAAIVWLALMCIGTRLQRSSRLVPAPVRI